MDYGKFRSGQQKKEHETCKKQKVISVKGVRLNSTIDANDFNAELRNACKFSEKGNKVKASIRFKGHVTTYKEIGQKVLSHLVEGTADVTTVEQKTGVDGCSMFPTLASKNDK